MPGTVPATIAGGALPSPPGYASSIAAVFPPSAPVFTAPPPMAYQPPVNRAGRLRVTNRNGTLAARAVSPQGRPPSAVTAEWAGEFGLGTVKFNGAVYRVLPVVPSRFDPTQLSICACVSIWHPFGLGWVPHSSRFTFAKRRIALDVLSDLSFVICPLCRKWERDLQCCLHLFFLSCT